MTPPLRFPDGTPITFADIRHWLWASVHHGTARPHRTTPGIDPQRRAELDAAARAERLERTGLAPGEHPAPMHLDIWDLLHDRGVDWADDAQVADWEQRALSTLGMLPGGQALAALCPWCDGRTAHAPAGGAFTLRVRVLRDGRPAVVCEGGGCAPPQADVGVEWHGLPAWPLAEWEWFAARLEHADEARRLAAAQLERMQAVEVDHADTHEWRDPASRSCGCGCGAALSDAGPSSRFASEECRRRAAQRSRRERRRAGRAVGGSAA